MSINSKIEWTENTWNPVTGCSKISTGCQNCYAYNLSLRLQRMGNPRYKNGFKVTMHYDNLELPLKWNKPAMIFVNSMSDLFHEEVSLDFIMKVFDVMHKAHWHTFQILTKRAERLAEIAPLLSWAPNIWQGVTIESSDYLNRIELLRSVPSTVRFISFEPLLGCIDHVDLTDMDWVIVGGESGPKARPMNEEWVLKIKETCRRQSVPFYFKQWGGINKKKNGRMLTGKYYNEMPEIINQ